MEELAPHNETEEEAMLRKAMELSRKQELEDQHRRAKLKKMYGNTDESVPSDKLEEKSMIDWAIELSRQEEIEDRKRRIELKKMCGTDKSVASDKIGEMSMIDWATELSRQEEIEDRKRRIIMKRYEIQKLEEMARESRVIHDPKAKIPIAAYVKSVAPKSDVAPSEHVRSKNPEKNNSNFTQNTATNIADDDGMWGDISDQEEVPDKHPQTIDRKDFSNKTASFYTSPRQYVKKEIYDRKITKTAANNAEDDGIWGDISDQEEVADKHSQEINKEDFSNDTANFSSLGQKYVEKEMVYDRKVTSAIPNESYNPRQPSKQAVWPNKDFEDSEPSLEDIVVPAKNRGGGFKSCNSNKTVRKSQDIDKGTLNDKVNDKSSPTKDKNRNDALIPLIHSKSNSTESSNRWEPNDSKPVSKKDYCNLPNVRKRSDINSCSESNPDEMLENDLSSPKSKGWEKSSKGDFQIMEGKQIEGSVRHSRINNAKHDSKSLEEQNVANFNNLAEPDVQENSVPSSQDRLLESQKNSASENHVLIGTPTVKSACAFPETDVKESDTNVTQWLKSSPVEKNLSTESNVPTGTDNGLYEYNVSRSSSITSATELEEKMQQLHTNNNDGFADFCYVEDSIQPPVQKMHGQPELPTQFNVPFGATSHLPQPPPIQQLPPCFRPPFGLLAANPLPVPLPSQPLNPNAPPFDFANIALIQKLYYYDAAFRSVECSGMPIGNFDVSVPPPNLNASMISTVQPNFPPPMDFGTSPGVTIQPPRPLAYDLLPAFRTGNYIGIQPPSMEEFSIRQPRQTFSSMCSSFRN